MQAFKTTLAYKVGTKRQRQFETNFEKTALKQSGLILRGFFKRMVRRKAEDSLCVVEQVGLVLSSALGRLSELFILQLDENLIEKYWSFMAFDVRGVCEHLELVCQTN
jgi:predicted alpha/beta-fold hydrolase